MLLLCVLNYLALFHKPDGRLPSVSARSPVTPTIPFSADGSRRSSIFVPLCSTQSRRLLIYKVVSTADLLSKQSLVVMFDLSWLVD